MEEMVKKPIQYKDQYIDGIALNMDTRENKQLLKKRNQFCQSLQLPSDMKPYMKFGSPTSDLENRMRVQNDSHLVDKEPT